MAALPPNNTERFRISYTVGGENHNFEVRTDSTSPTTLGAEVDAFLTQLNAVLNLVTITLVEFAAGGSNIFNPVTSGIEANTYGSGAGTGSAAANYINFIGRSTGGRRVRLMVFGLKLDATDYRFLPGESSDIDAAISQLKTPPDVFLAIDNIKPTWYTYANAGVNAHWQKALRP